MLEVTISGTKIFYQFFWISTTICAVCAYCDAATKQPGSGLGWGNTSTRIDEKISSRKSSKKYKRTRFGEILLLRNKKVWPLLEILESSKFDYQLQPFRKGGVWTRLPTSSKKSDRARCISSFIEYLCPESHGMFQITLIAFRLWSRTECSRWISQRLTRGTSPDSKTYGGEFPNNLRGFG